MQEKYFYEMLVTRIAGSLTVAFTLAFPFISASRVTSKFSSFYLNLSMNFQIDGVPDFSVLMKILGLRYMDFV